MDKDKIDALIKGNVGGIMLFVGVVGLLSNLLAFASFLPAAILDAMMYIVYLVKPAVYFNFINFDFMSNWSFATGIGYNYLSIIFYCLMIWGYFQFRDSGKTKVNVLLFSFSVILISQLITLLYRLVDLILDPSIISYISIRWLIGLAIVAAWAYISFRVLRLFSAKSAMSKTPKSHTSILDEPGFGVNPATSNLTTKNMRFAHHVLDLILCMSICSSVFSYLFLGFFHEIEYAVGGNVALVILVVMARLIYYPFFETVFGATPAKFLTGSRVTKKDDSKVTLGVAIGRTFSRMVPFEPFSFLGSNSGWHDSWTDTKVVKVEAETKMDDDTSFYSSDSSGDF